MPAKKRKYIVARLSLAILKSQSSESLYREYISWRVEGGGRVGIEGLRFLNDWEYGEDDDMI